MLGIGSEMHSPPDIVLNETSLEKAAKVIYCLSKTFDRT